MDTYKARRLIRHLETAKRYYDSWLLNPPVGSDDPIRIEYERARTDALEMIVELSKKYHI